MISSERASQEEQNGANFSFIAPSSEELWVQTLQMYVYGKGHCSGFLKLETLIALHLKVLCN